MTSPVGVITSGLALQLIAAPNSPAAGSVTLPRMSSSPATDRSARSRATDCASSNSAGTVTMISRVLTSCPLVRDAVSVAVAGPCPRAGRVITPAAVTTAGFELVQVMRDPATEPTVGRAMSSTMAEVRPRSIAAASARTPVTPGASDNAIASSPDNARS